jgi:hypothetical protein
MPEYIEDEDDLTDEDEQEEQQPRKHPSQPIEQQADGTWILGRGADRWIPSENQLGDMRWLVERDLRRELGVPPKTALNKDKIEFHKRQLALLDLAKQAPRCEHVFTDGRCCKAPRVKKGKLCYAHTLMEEKCPLELNLPPLEDANAVMLWLMDVLRGLAEGRTTEKTAGIMLYGFQLAMVNARFTTFHDTKHAEMVRKAPGDRRKLRNRASSPGSEGKALPLRAQRNRPDRAESPSSPSSPRSEEQDQSLSLRSTEEEGQDKGKLAQGEDSLEPQNAAVNPGVEPAKSIFFGVEAGEGVAGNRPVMPPPEPPRKSSQSEILVIPKDVEHHAGR